MLQSCGRSRLRQVASANAGCCAPGASPLKNCQPKSKELRIRAGGCGVWATNWPAESNAETRAAAPIARPSRPRRVIASFGLILITPFHKCSVAFRRDRSLTVAAPKRHPQFPFCYLTPADGDHVPDSGRVSDRQYPSAGRLLRCQWFTDGLSRAIE